MFGFRKGGSAAEALPSLPHQQKQIKALTAGLQKVSARIEVSRPAPQVADNNQ